MSQTNNHAAMMEWIGENMLTESEVTQEVTKGSTADCSSTTPCDWNIVKDCERIEISKEPMVMVDKETTGCDTNNVDRKLETCLQRREIHTFY